MKSFVPLVSSKASPDTDKIEGQISRFFSLSIIDISGLAFDQERQCLLVMSDTTKPAAGDNAGRERTPPVSDTGT